MNKTTTLKLIQCFVFIQILSGCTINVYHRPKQEPVSAEKSLLVIPQAPVASSAPIDAPRISEETEAILQMGTTEIRQVNAVDVTDAVEFNIQVNVDAYLNCYYQSGTGDIVKVFPNRFAPRYWVYAGQEITIPSTPEFHIVPDQLGASEAYMCLASSEDVLQDLPNEYKANVFQNLPVANFDAMYELYRLRTAKNLTGRSVRFQVGP